MRLANLLGALLGALLAYSLVLIILKKSQAEHKPTTQAGFSSWDLSCGFKVSNKCPAISLDCTNSIREDEARPRQPCFLHHFLTLLDDFFSLLVLTVGPSSTSIIAPQLTKHHSTRFTLILPRLNLQ
jgi:hypothetical protein